MATFNIVLDKKTKLKENKYNLAVRMVNANDVMYINLQRMTESPYDKAINKKVKDKESREFLDTCNGYISKCERIFSGLKPFNKDTLRIRFWETYKDKPKTLLLTDLYRLLNDSLKMLQMVLFFHCRILHMHHIT